MKKSISNAMCLHEAANDEEYEQKVIEAGRSNRILFAEGPPGTGKTHVVHDIIRHWKRKGCRILFALPTGQLACKMRALHPDIDVDTCHDAFLLHRPPAEGVAIVTQYDLVIAHEVSMVTAEHYERVVEMWRAADKVPCLTLLGDFWQLPIVDKETRPCRESAAWNTFVKTIDFYEQVRCKDSTLQAKLDELRTAVPCQRPLSKIFRGHRAWTTAEPTEWDILTLLRDKRNDTVITTCTRKGAALVNRLALQVLFQDRHRQAFGTLPLDYESNEEYYANDGSLLKDRRPKPSFTKLYKDMRVYLTSNVEKENDFVIGMSATVQDYDFESGCVEVLTQTGKRLSVYRICEQIPGHGHVSFYPIRVGYACIVARQHTASCWLPF